MALKKISAPQVAREFIREATLEECRVLQEYLNARFHHFQNVKKMELARGSIVTFVNSKQCGRMMVGRVDDIGRSRAKITCPGDGVWNVPLTRLTLADKENQEHFAVNMKTYGEPIPRFRRKSRDRQLLEKIMGMERPS